MFYGTCTECEDDADGLVTKKGLFFCHTCWQKEAEVFESLEGFRCFTFCAVYNESTGEKMGIGGSMNFCAERDALWKIDDVQQRKIVVVGRIRKNRNNKRWSFGDSKPCNQCIVAMKFYNVVRICYSSGSSWVWTNIDDLHNDYRTNCDVIVSI